MSPRPQRRFRVIVTQTVVYALHVTAQNRADARQTAERLFDEQSHIPPSINIEELFS